jgi:hypothetical protein
MEIMAPHEADKAFVRGLLDHFSDGAVLARLMSAGSLKAPSEPSARVVVLRASARRAKPVEKGVAPKSRPTSMTRQGTVQPAEGNHTMAILPTPEPTPTPAPTPPPFPEPKPVREPDPDRLPDEAPVPNPDENDAPLKIAPRASNPGI